MQDFDDLVLGKVVCHLPSRHDVLRLRGVNQRFRRVASDVVRGEVCDSSMRSMTRELSLAFPRLSSFKLDGRNVETFCNSMHSMAYVEEVELDWMLDPDTVKRMTGLLPKLKKLTCGLVMTL